MSLHLSSYLLIILHFGIFRITGLQFTFPSFHTAMDRVANLRIAQAVGDTAIRAQTSKIKWTRNLRISQNLVATKRADFFLLLLLSLLLLLLKLQLVAICLRAATANQHDGLVETDTGGCVGGRSYSSIRPGTNLWVATK